jgi:uncharacterized oligopeptide transporter (OPT) family protein
MRSKQSQALAEFRRILIWIVAIAVLMVIGALTYLGLTGELDTSMVVATTLGVFFSVVLGCGLFAAAFFSDKSGHDAAVDRSTKSERNER